MKSEKAGITKGELHKMSLMLPRKCVGEKWLKDKELENIQLLSHSGEGAEDSTASV